MSSSYRGPILIIPTSKSSCYKLRYWLFNYYIGNDKLFSIKYNLFLRARYGRVDLLRHQINQIGDVGVLKNGDHFIFYLATKQLHSDKPSLKNIYKALINLRAKVEELNIKELAIPRISAGKDRKSWGVIHNFVNFCFRGHENLNIYVCSL